MFTIAAVLVSSSAAFATDLSTQTGQELGITLSQYYYEEPDLQTDSGNIDVKLKGLHIGADYTTTMAFENDWFFKVDGRVAYGKVDYSGSGSHDGEPNLYFDIRPLFGKDYAVNSSVLAPYTGFGYRYLHNDGQGLTDTGYWGYRRQSQYFYLPIGVTHRFALDSNAILETNLEFDYLLKGVQKSYMSDGIGYGGITASEDVKNDQNRGYGFRLSSMYRVNNLAIGPYFNYWKIQDSEVSSFLYERNGTVYRSYGIEPSNHTVEFGIKASMRF